MLESTFIRPEEMTLELKREWMAVTDAFAKVYTRSKKSAYDAHHKVATHRDKDCGPTHRRGFSCLRSRRCALGRNKCDFPCSSAVVGSDLNKSRFAFERGPFR